ncbi:Alpha/Beta hydrolase protein [Mycena maculata]|uniref:Alpha/Beta hydrolase protein n=1 Tax=Mycena maculata TaxID=230809 RepID=A0AAD7KCX1_9AGAR|nr:Alpha/Beta hydrolase protein [Mycena maculata]
MYSHLSEPDPEFAPHIAALMAIPLISDLHERRKQFDTVFVETARKTYGSRLPKDTEYCFTDHQVDVANGKIRVRSVVPTTQDGSHATYPLMVWMHGGGWANGNVELDDYQLRAICVELQISIVNVEYRLAPEHPHPTGVNDCYTALKWVLTAAAESQSLLGADVKKGFIIAGLSAGGHLAAVLAHRARDDPFFKDREITGQILQVPAVLNPNAAVPEKYKPSLLSFEQNKLAPGLTADSIRLSFERLGGDPSDPEVSPLLYSSHAGLPPAVIQVCGLDPLRDEALLYEKLLKNESVETRLTVYPGVPHAFNYGFPGIKMAAKWEEDYRAGLRWLLDGAPRDASYL